MTTMRIVKKGGRENESVARSVPLISLNAPKFVPPVGARVVIGRTKYRVVDCSYLCSYGYAPLQMDDSLDSIEVLVEEEGDSDLSLL